MTRRILRRLRWYESDQNRPNWARRSESGSRHLPANGNHMATVAALLTEKPHGYAVLLGSANGNRTRLSALKGRCPNR